MNGNRIRLSVVGSTNLYTTELLGQSVIKEFTLVTSDFQDQGKGQRGKSWQSPPKENMLSSLVFFPNVKIEDQFLVSASASMVLLELLQEYGVIGQVKWPNDIFVKGKKIAGILIENQIKDGRVASSVIGVGLNVNQNEFEAFDWEATSLSLLSNQVVDVEGVMSGWQRLATERLRFWIQNRSGLIQAFNRKLCL
jgi:BirA family biotin operon repressor/biotin-[acetyl-CoA-carboxylase] ligase